MIFKLIGYTALVCMASLSFLVSYFQFSNGLFSGIITTTIMGLSFLTFGGIVFSLSLFLDEDPSPLTDSEVDK